MKGLAYFVWFGLAGVASIALFNITFEVEQLQDELNRLNKQILQEQKSVHVLRAEWSYLTRPGRIEALAERLLPYLQAPTSQQVGDIEQFQASIAERAAPAEASKIRPASAKGTQ
jgi:cell division protein FtsL